MSRLAEAMRSAIKKGKLSRYTIWKLTGIDQGHLSRFMSGQKGLSIESMELLADTLDLDIIIRPRATKAGNRSKRK